MREQCIMTRLSSRHTPKEPGFTALAPLPSQGQLLWTPDASFSWHCPHKALSGEPAGHTHYLCSLPDLATPISPTPSSGTVISPAHGSVHVSTCSAVGVWGRSLEQWPDPAPHAHSPPSHTHARTWERHDAFIYSAALGQETMTSSSAAVGAMLTLREAFLTLLYITSYVISKMEVNISIQLYSIFYARSHRASNHWTGLWTGTLESNLEWIMDCLLYLVSGRSLVRVSPEDGNAVSLSQCLVALLHGQGRD